MTSHHWIRQQLNVALSASYKNAGHLAQTIAGLKRILRLDVRVSS